MEYSIAHPSRFERWKWTATDMLLALALGIAYAALGGAYVYLVIGIVGLHLIEYAKWIFAVLAMLPLFFYMKLTTIFPTGFVRHGRDEDGLPCEFVVIDGEIEAIDPNATLRSFEFLGYGLKLHIVKRGLASRHYFESLKKID